MGNCLQMKNASHGGSEKKFIKSAATLADLKETYDIDQNVLGSGSYGKVFKANDKKDKSMQIAIKVINKSKLEPEDLVSLQNEVKLMQQVDHPNIVKYYETYDDSKYIYLCMELCTGGELFEKITARGKPFDENECATVMLKLLRALQHCHSQCIIHRDIKPENIMYGKNDEVKFIDFGFAIAQHGKKQEMDICGSPYYIAPEVLTGAYGKECDIWSLGVTLYQLLTGEMPFDGSGQQEVFRKIKKGTFKMPSKLSDDCKDLLTQMITVDQAKRITPQLAINHPFFDQQKRKTLVQSMSIDEQKKLDTQVLQKMKSYRGASLLKKAAVNVLVKHLEQDQIQKLKEEFEKLDTDNSGFLEAKELQEAIANADLTMTQEEIKKIIDELDFAANKRINYSEFIAATINIKDYLDDNRLEAIFNQFDIDNSGKVTVANLKQAFSKFGREISDDDIKTIMKEHDVAGDGAISLPEFKKMMLGN